MASVMRKIKHQDIGKGLYPWGKAELTDRWVILHDHGGPKWAIYYKQKTPSVVVPCHLLGTKKKIVRPKGSKIAKKHIIIKTKR